jgi:hypothetical protein
MAWRWADGHSLATAVMVAVPTMMVLISVRESADWFVASLTVTSGFCWVGVLLPAMVRETALLVSGAVAAICGALVSIMFSQSLDTPGHPDPAFAPLFFGLLAAGSASIYGQHRNGVEQRIAAGELAAALLRLSERQAADAKYLGAAIEAVSTLVRGRVKEPRRSAVRERRSRVR